MSRQPKLGKVKLTAAQRDLILKLLAIAKPVRRKATTNDNPR